MAEIGVLVRPYKKDSMVVHWRVTKMGANQMYETSMGWIDGLSDGSDYFTPAPRERSLRPCIIRALNYAMKNWPRWRNETH